MIQSTFIKLNLETEMATIQPAVSQTADGVRCIPWPQYLKNYAERRILSFEREEILDKFSAERLRERLAEGETLVVSNYLSDYPDTGEILYATTHLVAMLFENQEGERCAHITFRYALEDELFRTVIHNYILKDSDYLVCLSARTNSYVMMFRRRGGAQDFLMSPVSEDYESEIQSFIREHVYWRDQEELVRQTRIAHILEMFREQDSYTVTYGLIEGQGEYKHKSLSFSYYDKARSMLLLSRADVTANYLEKQALQLRMEEALLNAQIDPLTGLWNSRSTIQRIASLLSRQNNAGYFLMFIDIDDFKQVNDTMGHLNGNLVLMHLARIFGQYAEAEDVVGRGGGDEFVFFGRCGGCQSEHVRQKNGLDFRSCVQNKSQDSNLRVCV